MLEAGSGRFRGVPAYAGVGSGGQVPEGSGKSCVWWFKFRRQVPEGRENSRVSEGLRAVCGLATLRETVM